MSRGSNAMYAQSAWYGDANRDDEWYLSPSAQACTHAPHPPERSVAVDQASPPRMQRQGRTVRGATPEREGLSALRRARSVPVRASSLDPRRHPDAVHLPPPPGADRHFTVRGAVPLGSWDRPGAHTAPRGRAYRDQPVNRPGAVPVWYRTGDAQFRMLRMEEVPAGEPEMLVTTLAHPDFVTPDRDEVPDECVFLGDCRLTAEGYRVYEDTVNTVIHTDQERMHADMVEGTRTLQEALRLWNREGFLCAKGIILDVAQQCLAIANERFRQYTAYCFRQSTSRGRLLTIMAYQHLANGCLALATAIDPDEPCAPNHPKATRSERDGPWTWRYCDNQRIAELLRLGCAFAHPELSNRCDLAERWWENAQLWLARDDGARKIGMTVYSLALRNMKSALSRSDPNLRR